MNGIKRRNFIKNILVGISASLLATNTQAKLPTPSEIEGPFYPLTPQADTDADLTKVKGKSGVAKGEIIEVSGRILDQELNPIENVTIDIWQANCFGNYHHPSDISANPQDDNFQTWAILKSDSEGRYKFKSVMPGLYTIKNGTETRTPHIHFKLAKNSYISLLTQMYFPNHPMNEQDLLIRRRPASDAELMTAKLIAKTPSNISQYYFDMIIERL